MNELYLLLLWISAVLCGFLALGAAVHAGFRREPGFVFPAMAGVLGCAYLIWLALPLQRLAERDRAEALCQRITPQPQGCAALLAAMIDRAADAERKRRADIQAAAAAAAQDAAFLTGYLKRQQQ